MLTVQIEKKNKAMKLDKAFEIMSVGYVVAFDKKGEEIISDCFPEISSGEPYIPTKERAAVLAEIFNSTAGPEYVNIRVQDQDGKDVFFPAIQRQY